MTQFEIEVSFGGSSFSNLILGFCSEPNWSNKPEMEVGVAGNPAVRATFRLGDETHEVQATKGTTLSEQLVSLKEESMEVLKEFITKHNAPAEVPDEALEGSDGEDEGEILAKPPVKKRK